MAALSVQSAAGGTFSSMPRAAHSSSTRERSREWRPRRPDRQPAVSRPLQPLAQLDHQGLHHRPLVRRRQVGTPSECLFGAEIRTL